MDKATQPYSLYSAPIVPRFIKPFCAKFKTHSSILLCSMIGLAIGLIALKLSLKIMLGLFVLLIIGIIGLLKPEVVAIMLAFLLPFHLEWEMAQLAGIKVGTTSLLVAVGILSIIINQFLNRKTKFPQIPNIIPWLLLAIFMCAAYIHSPFFIPEPAKIPWHLYRTILRFLLIFPLFFILIKTKGEKLVKGIILALLISTTLTAAVGIIQTAFNVSFHPFHFGIGLQMLNTRPDVQGIDEASGILRAFGSFTHSNAFAGFLILTLSMTAGIFLFAKKNKLWYAAAISGIFQLLALMCTMSRGGWIAFSCSFFIMTILAKKKRLILVALISLFVIVLFLPAASVKKISSRAHSIAKPTEVEEFTFRQGRWSSFLEIISKNPILGTGEAVLEHSSDESIGQTPHNMYLYFAVQYGIPALILFLYFLGQVIYRSFINFRMAQHNWHKTVSLGALGSMVALMIHGSVDALVGIDQIWTAFWLVAAIAFSLGEPNSDNNID